MNLEKSVQIIYYDVILDQLVVLESLVDAVTMLLIGIFQSENHTYIGTMD